MKLHTDPRSGNAITAYGEGYVTINAEQHTQSLIVQPDTLHTDWQVNSAAELNAAHFARLAATGADVLILGTGKRQHFPAPALLRPVMETGRTVDVMDTAAACRTYNILMAEGRSVAAALIIE